MAKKKAKPRLPKTVAGVKVPKALRKSGAVAALLNTPLGREILADVLVAAAGAAAAALARHRPSAQQVAHAGEAAVETGAQAASSTKHLAELAAGALAEVLTDAARNVLPASLTGVAEGKQNKRPGRSDEPKKAKKGRNPDTASRH